MRRILGRTELRTGLDRDPIARDDGRRLEDQEKIRDEELGFPIEPGKPYLYVKVKGLDALVTHLKSKNIPVLSGPIELHWGPRMASVKDPDGVPVMFVEWAQESD